MQKRLNGRTELVTDIGAAIAWPLLEVEATAHGASGRGDLVAEVFAGLVETPLLHRRPAPPPPELWRWCLKPEEVAATVLATVALPPGASRAEGGP